MAQSVINALEAVTQEPSLLTSHEEIVAAYQHVIKMCGGQLEHIVSLETIHEIIAAKIEKQVYSVAHLTGTGTRVQH
jgi:hypothetical protein